MWLQHRCTQQCTFLSNRSGCASPMSSASEIFTKPQGERCALPSTFRSRCSCRLIQQTRQDGWRFAHHITQSFLSPDSLTEEQRMRFAAQLHNYNSLTNYCCPSDCLSTLREAAKMSWKQVWERGGGGGHLTGIPWTVAKASFGIRIRIR